MPESHNEQKDVKSKNSLLEMDAPPDDTEGKDPFQVVMEKAGNNGRFQAIYNIVFVIGLGAADAMIYMNIILALNIPDHWCTVPGREGTNFTIEDWKRTTLPMQLDNRGQEKYSSCQMYDANFTAIHDWEGWNEEGVKNTSIVACKNGWSYDETWYDSTIPTKENWVCSKDMYVTNVFGIGRVTEVVGSFVLGQMGDIYGRRLVYYLSVVFCAAGRIISMFTTGEYYWFVIFSALAALAVNSLLVSAQIIGMEISREEDRSRVAAYQCLGWSIGTVSASLLFWWLRDWEPFLWYTTIPTVLVLFFSRYVIESPRWLISRRRFAEAISQFKKIAKINGREFDMSEKELAQMFINMKTDNVYGVASLFDGGRLARNTTIMSFNWCAFSISYLTLILFSSRMGGNPYLNFLLLSAVEIPGYLLARYLGDKYGRRFTNAASFLLSFLICIPAIIIATDEKLAVVMLILTVIINCLNEVTFFTLALQCIEIYPTCLRQTGRSLGTILGSASGVLAPYMVHLGTTIDIRTPYYIMAALFLLAGIGASFLPETLHKKLPDTMDEARNFGKNDKFFSLPKDPAQENELEMEAKKLNQKQYAP